MVEPHYPQPGRKGEEIFFGLNLQGVILFFVLLFVCFPLFWIPWLLESCQAARPMGDSQFTNLRR